MGAEFTMLPVLEYKRYKLNADSSQPVFISGPVYKKLLISLCRLSTCYVQGYNVVRNIIYFTR